MATLAYFFLFLCEFQQGMDLRICGEIPAEESGYVWVKTPTRSSVTLVVPTQMKKQNQGGKGGKSLHVTWGSKVHLQSSGVSISNGGVSNIKPDEVMAVSPMIMAFGPSPASSPPRPSVNLTWRASTIDSTFAFILDFLRWIQRRCPKNHPIMTSLDSLDSLQGMSMMSTRNRSNRSVNE